LAIRIGSDAYDGSLGGDGVGDVPAPCRFVAAAVRVCARRLRLAEVDVRVETWSELDGDQCKAGLGTSAAVVSATTAAIYALAGRAGQDLRSLVSAAVGAHRLAQGSGSGADVVASTLGGLQCITGLDAAHPPATVRGCLDQLRFETEPLQLPGNLRIEAVAVGAGARTGPRVRRFVERARGHGPLGAGGAAIVGSWGAGMGAAVEDFRGACRGADPRGALAAVARARSLLSRLGAVAGIGIWTPGLRRACSVLASCEEVEIKPSGAGGGDCAVALLPEPRVEDLRTAWRAVALQPLETPLSPDGVRVAVVREGREHG